MPEDVATEKKNDTTPAENKSTDDKQKQDPVVTEDVSLEDLDTLLTDYDFDSETFTFTRKATSEEKKDDKPAENATAKKADDQKTDEKSVSESKPSPELEFLKERLEANDERVLTLLEKMAASDSDTPDDEGESLAELAQNEPKRFQSKIAEMIDAASDKKLEAALGKNYKGMLKQYEIGLELQEVMGKNPDFSEYVPAISAIIQERPETTYPQAFAIAKKLGLKTAKKADDKNNPSSEKAKDENKSAATDGNADALIEKSEKLKVESGVAGTHGSGKNPVKDLKGALAASLEELGLL